MKMQLRSFLMFEGSMFTYLKLSYHEVNHFFHKFQQIDMNKSGTVGVLDILMWFDVERTTFNEFILGSMDIDGSGAADFQEFLCTYWNFCSLTPEGICHLVFSMFSNKEDHSLGMQEIYHMCQCVFGNKWRDNRQATACHTILMKRYHIPSL